MFDLRLSELRTNEYIAQGGNISVKEYLPPDRRRRAEHGTTIVLKNLTLGLFRRLFDETEFQTGPQCGIALQAYLRDCEADLRELVTWARARRRRITVRLVKGAYWDYETVIARQRGWSVPVFERKPESDLSFERLSTYLLENEHAVTAAFASHNLRSLAHVLAEADRLGVDRRAFEFQVLYGMADAIKSRCSRRYLISSWVFLPTCGLCMSMR